MRGRRPTGPGAPRGPFSAAEPPPRASWSRVSSRLGARQLCSVPSPTPARSPWRRGCFWGAPETPKHPPGPPGLAEPAPCVWAEGTAGGSSAEAHLPDKLSLGSDSPDDDLPLAGRLCSGLTPVPASRPCVSRPPGQQALWEGEVGGKVGLTGQPQPRWAAAASLALPGRPESGKRQGKKSSEEQPPETRPRYP